jgi:mRNA-degrading endonuclease toxin of MazEF toxin-antitoxin module
LPVALEDLKRGAVCIGLYPFSLGFPLHQVVRDSVDEVEANLEEHPTIEEFEKTIQAEDVPEVAIRLKLRRVLLLQDASHSGRQDVIVAQIRSVKESQRSREAWYNRLLANQIPFLYRLTEQQQGVKEEAVVNLTQISTVNRDTLLRWTGQLSEAEMRTISEKLIDTLELDISGRIQALRG